ncbi:MAG: methyltransferase domain-containing protein [Candidatus Accumulibacter sp. UW20]|jgi:SAM-dependent methyltransferase
MDRKEFTDSLSILLRECSDAVGGPYYSNATQMDGLLFRIAYVFQKNATIIDLGGGLSPVNGVLAMLGMNVIVYDLLSVYWDDRFHTSAQNQSLFKILQKCGVRFIEKNLDQLDLTESYPHNSADIIVSHHCIEHFHNSPKALLESAIKVVKPDGRLIIEVPNAANALKRLRLLFGHTNYPSYKEYYESDKYYGHVREYTTEDLKSLAQYLRQSDFKLFGTNYLGLDKIPSSLRGIVDSILRTRPGLCASIYLDITKH